MRLIMKFPMVILMIALVGCDISQPIQKVGNSVFDVIEHAAIHIQDGTGLVCVADSVMPGPHLDPDSIEHRRIDVTLVTMNNGFGGYLHFGPDVTGDILVCMDAEASVAVVNRNGNGDSEIEIERTFTAREISDSAGTTMIKKAVLFEAKTGGNVLQFGPVSHSDIKVVIEEVEHDHD